MADIPVVLTTAGAQPTPPAVLLADLIAGVTAVNPGYTVLPAGLIEDVSSTEVAGLAVCDTARIETINSLTPFGANEFLLSQLGQIYIGPGAAPAVPTNTSVFVVFTAIDATTDAPLPGFVVSRGFVVSDGTYQYIVQDTAVTGASGQTQPIFCQATISGSWSVATNTVSQIVTSVPSTITLSCANPVTGISGAAAETSAQYRARVLQAGQAISTGTATLLKTLLSQVPGVQQRLISTVQQPGGGWEIIVGGGDPYLVAGAIYNSGLDISTLVGSTLAVTNITQANPGVVTTDLNHGFTSGQAAAISGIVGMTELNGVPLTVTVLSEKTFSIGIDTTGYLPYIRGGVVLPNPRNLTPNLYDYPDIYSVPFVNPPQQNVTMVVTWGTIALNFVSVAAVSQLAGPAIVEYINSITVGAPINELVIESVFLAAVASVLAPSQISALSFSVSINGVVTAPQAGTSLIFGDPESFFEAPTGGIVVEQGS